MSFLSLIAHNGVTHKKSIPEPKITPSTTETKTNQKPNIDTQTVVPEGNSTLEKQVVETPESKTENSNTTEIQAIQEESTATFIIGFGESIFTLLIASPFLLFGLKKWLHR
ncbi:MAG: hypothetical protein QNJ70_25955 [Xenococcaceae cyanobacterium MO_207.B15]|nr:hypothetical protein [Xenococcaceae cyanobacterium MO_207.B15]MDJ0742968.1 hypothetical protein [Xenococcaceae cyanobacterium MO_167.B27]